MSYKQLLEATDNALSSLIRLNFARLTNEPNYDDRLHAEADKYTPLMLQLLKYLQVKDTQLRDKRAADIKQIYEREYHHYIMVLETFDLQPAKRAAYQHLQWQCAAKIYGLLNIITHQPCVISV